MKYLVAILGPTAVGKTACTIQCALQYNAEIISCDSRQFYNEMSIGTAKPSQEDLQTVPHHFIGHKSISEFYTAGQFEADAIEKISELHTKNNLVFMVGGSGMYARAVFEGLDDIPSDLVIREQLNQQLENEGLESILIQLEQLDPIYFKTIKKDNPQRVIRAVEACLASGKPYSTLRTASKKTRDFKIVKIGLNMDRTQLYDRINQRVDQMVDSGLIDEVKSLLPQRALNALNTVGYKELFAHLEGEGNLADAIGQVKRNTRRFAKRQLTWFKKEDQITWFDASETSSIIDFIQKETDAATVN